MFIINEHKIKLNKAMRRTKKGLEEQILTLAIAAFQKNIPAKVKIEVLAEEPAYIYAYRPDRKLRMIIQERAINYNAEIKTAITKETRLLMLMNKEKLDLPLLLITRYVNPQMAEQLKQDGIEFMDTAGNAFINAPTQPPFYIFVKGNKPPEILELGRPRRRFKPVGLKIVFAFLCNPGFENETYREIAAVTNVALGTVGWIMRELKELGFLLDMGKRGRKLIQKENLFREWVVAYPERLRQKLILGRFRGELDWWQHVKLDPLTAQWGGEVAAAKLTQYLKPEIATIYIDARQLDRLLLGNRLKRDVIGDVEILERFWQPGKKLEDSELVHPILIYADLLATGNERNLEAAKIIYDRNIIRLIRED
jgi:hypothetical protein